MIRKFDDVIQFNLGVAAVNYNTKRDSFTIMCMAIDWEAPFDAYGLEESLEYELSGTGYDEKIKFDSESGCFFAYTDSPKAAMEIIKKMKKIIELKYSEEEEKEFLEHHLIRLKYVTE